MSIPKGADKYSWEHYPMYREGWESAKLDWNDLIPYDEDTRHEELVAPESEEWADGYYHFWKTKNFQL